MTQYIPERHKYDVNCCNKRHNNALPPPKFWFEKILNSAKISPIPTESINIPFFSNQKILPERKLQRIGNSVKWNMHILWVCWERDAIQSRRRGRHAWWINTRYAPSFCIVITEKGQILWLPFLNSRNFAQNRSGQLRDTAEMNARKWIHSTRGQDIKLRNACKFTRNSTNAKLIVELGVVCY